MADPDIIVGAFETVENEVNDTNNDVEKEQVIQEENTVQDQEIFQSSPQIKQEIGRRGAKCEVRFCPNTSENLEEWEKEYCTIHNEEHKSCSCPPPFQLYAFPSKRIASAARENWIKVLKEDDTSKGEKWQPKSLSRVCSKHFADGEPTNQNPLPTLYISRLLTDYSQVQPVNTFIYYVGDTPSRPEDHQDPKADDNTAQQAWGPDSLVSGPPVPALMVDQHGRETFSVERCPETGRAIGNWNGFRLYRDYSLECWKNYGQKFDCIIPTCKRKRYNNEVFLQIPVIPTDELTTRFISIFIHILKKFGGVTANHFRKVLQSPSPQIRFCRHHIPSVGAVRESPYRSVCNFVASCAPLDMKPAEILGSLTTMVETEYDECAAIYNSFLLLRYSTSFASNKFSRKDFDKASNYPQIDEKAMRYFDLWKTDSFTDVELICKDGRKVKSHKVYLSAVSVFLRSLLLEHEDEELSQIHLPDYEYEDLVNMVLLIYSGVIYNERESIECLQRLLNDLGITIEATADGEEVYVVKPAGNHVLAKPESKPKEHINFNIDQPVISALPAKREFTQILKKEAPSLPSPPKQRKVEAPPPKPILKKHKAVQYLCQHCPSVFFSEGDLNNHLASSGCYKGEEDEFAVKVECVVCGETFPDDKIGFVNAQRHVTYMHRGESFGDAIKLIQSSSLCDMCGELLYSDRDYWSHRKLHYDMNKRDPTTHSLKSFFGFRSYFEDRHKALPDRNPLAINKTKKTEKGSLISCDQCGENFVAEITYKDHLKLHLKHSCKHCEALFASEFSAKEHVLTGKCRALNATLGLFDKKKRVRKSSSESDDGTLEDADSEADISDEEFVHFC
ncbi:uncharacterized protein LOC136031689 isoform X1 [Artemia franciscana]|uniref:uncharacterized protein LOC136031689 isoform X1 n=1 Tax=Artemia franciscana TaxID=6661 RepID=UPI0032DB418C